MVPSFIELYVLLGYQWNPSIITAAFTSCASSLAVNPVLKCQLKGGGKSYNLGQVDTEYRLNKEAFTTGRVAESGLLGRVAIQ